MKNHAPRNITTAKGFTLIELLVSIGVVATLVSTLLPALGSARDSAQRVKCSTQQKILGDGVANYAIDHSNKVPYSSAVGVAGPSIHDAGQDYVGLGLLYEQKQVDNPQLFFCPKSNHFSYENQWPKDNDVAGKNIGSSYLYRERDSGIPPPGEDKLEDNIDGLANKAMILDFNRLYDAVQWFNDHDESVNITRYNGTNASSVTTFKDSGYAGSCNGFDLDAIVNWADEQVR